MPWLSEEAETYKVEVRNPDNPEEVAEVTLRRLNAGQHAEVQDSMFDEEKGEGHTRLVIVRHAIVDWTLPVGAYSPDKVQALDPAVFLQIYAGIKKEDLNPFGQAVRLAVSPKTKAAGTRRKGSRAPAASADDVAG